MVTQIVETTTEIGFTKAPDAYVGSPNARAARRGVHEMGED